MSDERSRDADAFEGGDQTTTGATRPLTIATRGGIAIDFPHQAPRVHPTGVGGAAAAGGPVPARTGREGARARQAADERLQRQLEDLGIAESDVKRPSHPFR
jgi:hypothetical protein